MELCLDRVSKQYRSKNAVDRFSLTFVQGVYGLLGPNGSGKTTLMRMLADVLRPTSGEITAGGVDIHKMDESYRDLLGYLPQDFGYYRDFTAMDFLLYLSALKGIENLHAKRKANELLNAVGLNNEGKSKIRTFSGGMRQRLGIAQALLNDPKILILDEPTAGLDPQERIRFRNLISDLSADRIVLLSTHIVSDIEYIADSVVLMKKGQLLKVGTSDEIAHSVDGKVWTATVSSHAAQRLQAANLIANLQHKNQDVALRIIADECPCGGAVKTASNLEDAYLYYFGEVSGR
ncbi:ABC transporter ATP-binding protein [Ohessyouella blattaphilus]|uniref:ABC transporter ATP-binding protein n=1 Tax=Ohessyouella blattaphilus TaxID=2949333 RepID=A0ABT1EGS1_9FIRM|nr:ABC transporter ATP-binding protein [Ohessyouella blattaphilus]MCP1109716.1 ABC transporter ATP-binding protein [Ohessyouella blattaphilus]MCR8563110.1 ABC transporter ATP-binding protein [Ohessyouella blattaphilus]